MSCLAKGMPRLEVTETLEQFLSENLDARHGAKLKVYEDALDALVCAYIAAHYWAWGGERNEMLGSMTEGYIVVPTRTSTGEPWRYARPESPTITSVQTPSSKDQLWVVLSDLE